MAFNCHHLISTAASCCPKKLRTFRLLPYLNCCFYHISIVMVVMNVVLTGCCCINMHTVCMWCHADVHVGD